jgi:hypothetical protein
VTCTLMLILLSERNTHTIVQVYQLYEPSNIHQNKSEELSVLFPCLLIEIVLTHREYQIKLNIPRGIYGDLALLYHYAKIF